MRIWVTGAAGFIGAHLSRLCLKETQAEVWGLDYLGFASDRRRLSECEQNPRFHLREIDLRRGDHVRDLFHSAPPDLILHLAAETHVDRSIEQPVEFFENNTACTLSLLEVMRTEKPGCHLHQVSTDEVFGPSEKGEVFDESSAYRPRNPYSASKAAADHLIRAYANTYGLSLGLSFSCNNFGPGQHEEKWIPTILRSLKSSEPIPLYGEGHQQRAWLYVEEHCQKILSAARERQAVSCFGSPFILSNRDLATRIHALAKEMGLVSKALAFKSLPDRPGHDEMYRLKWDDIPSEAPSSFEDNLKRTIEWYFGF